METALASGTFSLYRLDDAKLFYASLLSRTRRPAEALRFLTGLPVSAESLFVETKARIAIGDEQGARASALSSLRRYPVDPRPLLFWLRTKARPTLTGADAEVVAAGFAALEKLKEIDSGVLVALAPYAASADEARFLVREYRAAGGSSADATALALELGLVSEDRAVREMLAGSYPVSVGHIRRVHSALSSDEARARLASAFSTYSGELINDADGDGYPESIVSYSAGLPARWALDENQDGVSEMSATFVSGVPGELMLRSGDTEVFVSYDSWPHARRIEFHDAEGARKYSLGPGAMPLPVVAVTAVTDGAGAPRYVERTRAPAPSETAVARAAHAVERTSNGNASETAELYDGEPSRAWWTDPFGRSGYATYREGLPLEETIDGDGDGRRETRRVWRRNAAGLPEAIYLESDLDGDGRYEFRETLSGARLKSWDYDGDGALDLTLETRPDGSAVYRYLTVRGRVTEAVYRDGIIEAVLENGRPMPIVRDSGGAVFWIGSKPFDFGSASPREGRGSRNGVMYTVFSVAGRLYAQTLE
jgi:hypothetical protein